MIKRKADGRQTPTGRGRHIRILRRARKHKKFYASPFHCITRAGGKFMTNLEQLRIFLLEGAAHASRTVNKSVGAPRLRSLIPRSPFFPELEGCYHERLERARTCEATRDAGVCSRILKEHMRLGETGSVFSRRDWVRTGETR